MHQAIQQYINAVAEANGQTAHQGKIGMFNVSPAVSQKLRGAVRLSNAFLNQIRFVTKEAIGLLRKGGGCTDRNCGQCRGSTGSLDKAAAGNELFHRERPPLIQYALSALSFHAVQRCFPFWGADVLLQNRKGTLLPKS